MVTLAKTKCAEPLGELAGDCSIPVGQPGSAVVRLSVTGAIVRRAILSIPEHEPAIRVMQYSVMPDHVHVLLFVTKAISAPLGNVIARMKASVTQACGGISVFEGGFNDQILKQTRSLDAMFAYIRANPHRLAVRRAFPDFFRRMNRLVVDGVEMAAYGNMQLLDNPCKEVVVVHRADSASCRAHNRDVWIHAAANGGVLVSPFISMAEREIRREAEALGGRIILLTYKAFPAIYKPAAHDFALCESGRLLVVSPSESWAPCRRTFLRLNGLAAKL